MAGGIKIKEEEVTRQIIKWLVDNGWDIICFDFPQSGTGRTLHPSNTSSKTEGIIIPDIVAYRNGVVIDFENKDRFVFSDFEKIKFLRNTKEYDDAWSNLLIGHQYNHIYYGIGMPYSESNYRKAESNSEMVDFIVFVKDDGEILLTGNIGGSSNDKK